MRYAAALAVALAACSAETAPDASTGLPLDLEYPASRDLGGYADSAPPDASTPAAAPDLAEPGAPDLSAPAPADLAAAPPRDLAEPPPDLLVYYCTPCGMQCCGGGLCSSVTGLPMGAACSGGAACCSGLCDHTASSGSGRACCQMVGTNCDGTTVCCASAGAQGVCFQGLCR